MKTDKAFLIVILLSFIFIPSLSAKDSGLAEETLLTFGKTFLQQNRYVEAKQEFEKCLLLNPDHSQARQLLEFCDSQILLERDRAMLLALEEREENANPQLQAPTRVPLEEPSEIESSSEIESLAPPIQKGAWTLKEGEVYVESYTKYYWHNHKFDDDGKKVRWDYDGKGNEIRTELKLEYGYNDRLTLMLSTVAKEAHWKDIFKSCTTKGFVEIWPGAKYLLFKEPLISSLQFRTKFPFDYSEEAVPALGTHQIDAEIKLLTAQTWPKLPGYTKLELGFRGRNEEPANEIPYFFEFGYNLIPKLILKTTLDGNAGLAQTGGIDEDWLKYTAGPILKLSDFFNLEFGFGHTFYGKNTTAAKEVFLTFSCQW